MVSESFTQLTLIALVELFDRISNSLSNREYVIGVFMDLSKAFDTLDHSILLHKLQFYGVRGTALKWFHSYLSDRKQYTVYNSVKSNVSDIQVSPKGPFLVLCYS